MKFGARELKPVAVSANGSMPASVRIVMLMHGVPLGQQEAPSHLVRQLAAELIEACDLAERRSLGQQ